MKSTIVLAAAALAAAGCAPHGQESLSLIPWPSSVETGRGEFVIAGAPMSCIGIEDSLAVGAVREFAAGLSLATGRESVLAPDAPVRFVQDDSEPAEGYSLSVETSGIEVRASSAGGFIYAIQTLRQLLPVEIYSGRSAQDVSWTVPCVEIEDAPRFGYRGLHLDVSRHFFSVDQVKKMLDVMSVYKLNTLHWHLTDDQGWRIEIKKYPRLTGVGSVRKGTVVRKDWDRYDGVPYGGFYTQDEIREVIAYAASRGITVVPEIDLPGHMLAALAAYPQYGCTGGPYDVWGRWGVSEEVLCAGNEQTMLFLEDVLAEVADLFPSEYIHIGGDECPKSRWEKCPRCQAKIRELGLQDKDGFTAEHYLQSYVMGRMEHFLEARGKRIIGWDEILEGTPGPEAIVMSWRGSEGGIKASAMGHDVIMTPNSHFYFDYYQSEDTDNEPFGIGGYVPVEKVYSYDPYLEIAGSSARSHILGIQANVWTEYIATPEHLEYMVLPRLAALAEVQWTLPQNKDWDRFLSNLSHEAAMYDAAGYNYAKTVFQVIASITVDEQKECVLAALSTQGDAPIRYTLDGSDPDSAGILYTAPVEIRDSCILQARVMRDNMQTRTYVRKFVANKAMGKKAVLNTQPREKYRYGAPQSFVNGIRGVFQYTSGQWAGWFGEPLSVTIDMGTSGVKYSGVTLGTMSIQDEDIFPPLSLKVSVSDDGASFREAAFLEIPMEGQGTPDGLREYTVRFDGTDARYIKVEAATLPQLPLWHGRAGSPGFLFVDEIIVL